MDAHEKQVQEKTKTEFTRDEALVNNNIDSLYTSIVVLIRETVKHVLFKKIQTTAKALLGDNASLPTHAVDRLGEVMQSVKTNWAQAERDTNVPSTSVEATLIQQAQTMFTTLDCHRRVLTVAYQTYQTNQLQNELGLMKNVYTIKNNTVSALWARVQELVTYYYNSCDALVASTQTAIQQMKTQQDTEFNALQQSINAFMTRVQTLWNSYKSNVDNVADTNNAANDLQIALDTLLASKTSYTVTDTFQASKLLKKHWQAVAEYLEKCPFATTAATGTGTGTSSRLAVLEKAIQANAEKMLFCAKERAKVLKSRDKFPDPALWVAELRKWDAVMRKLEQEGHLLRRQRPPPRAVAVEATTTPATTPATTPTGTTTPTTPTTPTTFNTFNTTRNPCVLKYPEVLPAMVTKHRQTKRLVYALGRLGQQLQQQQQELQHHQAAMHAVLLNKVTLELKQMTEGALHQLQTMEREHVGLERASLEAEQDNFRVLDTQFKQESQYMSNELQGYGKGTAADTCLTLLNKLYQLKTWHDHATYLKEQLDVLRPVVAKITRFVTLL